MKQNDNDNSAHLSHFFQRYDNIFDNLCYLIKTPVLTTNTFLPAFFVNYENEKKNEAMIIKKT